MTSKASILIEPLKRGRVIADTFEVVSKIGEGGCGSVYKCKHLKKKGVIVAVKVLDQPEDVQRFHREGNVLKGTRHPNVVRLYGKGLIDGRPYLAMEFINGGSVRDLLKSKRKLPQEEAGWLLVQTVRGLRAAGTVHRDLKPENLLLVGNRRVTQVRIGEEESDSGTQVKVADFGLAKSVGGGDSLNLTHSGQVMGTPVYMSPEQCRSSKNVSFKTDVYAVGIMLYEMVNGKLPFDGSNVYDIMNMHCDQEPAYPKRMPREARAICERCLQKAAGQRYRSLAALERDLAHLAGVPSEGGGGGCLVKMVLVLIVLAGLAAAAWYFQGHYTDLWQRYLPEVLWREVP
ncbi:MAG: serine/threonine protein kinase [Planctomycetota bacterium]